jgi:hypothetical protein
MSSMRVVKVQIDITTHTDFATVLQTELNSQLGAGPYLVVHVEKRGATSGKETYYVWVVDNPLT